MACQSIEGYKRIKATQFISSYVIKIFYFLLKIVLFLKNVSTYQVAFELLKN